MNKACRCSLRRWALCPFVVRLSRTFFRFVTFFQNVVKSVKLFLSRGKRPYRTLFPFLSSSFCSLCEISFAVSFMGANRLCMATGVYPLHAKDGPGRFLSEHVAELVTHASSSSSLCQAARRAFLRLCTLPVNKNLHIFQKKFRLRPKPASMAGTMVQNPASVLLAGRSAKRASDSF